MKQRLAGVRAGLLFVALLLAGCQAQGGGASLTPSAQVAAAKGLYGFELAYSTAAQTYEAALPELTAAGRKDQAKALMMSLLACDAGGKCTGAVQLARDAVAAGDASDVASQTAAITAIAAQITSLINASK